MPNTFVSVVMPAYNAAGTLACAIDSVLAQTHRDFELIVIDDCSRDQTADIAREYAARDARVRFLQNAENSGVSLTRNNGVAAARHEWIAFLDSDDTWHPEKLEKQLAALEEHPACSLFFTATAYVDEQGERSDFILRAPARVTRKDVLKQNVISCSSSLVRRELLEKFPMLNDRMIHEDMATWFRVLTVTPYAVGVDEPLLIYRVSKSGKSGNKFAAAKMQWRTYRALRIPFFASLGYFLVYAFRNVKKYAAL